MCVSCGVWSNTEVDLDLPESPLSLRVPVTCSHEWIDNNRGYRAAEIDCRYIQARIVHHRDIDDRERFDTLVNMLEAASYLDNTRGEWLETIDLAGSGGSGRLLWFSKTDPTGPSRHFTGVFQIGNEALSMSGVVLTAEARRQVRNMLLSVHRRSL